MVQPDIGGKPAQDVRQVIMGSAAQRRLVKIPALVMGPESVLELVLDVNVSCPPRYFAADLGQDRCTLLALDKLGLEITNYAGILALTLRHELGKRDPSL